MKNTSIKTKLMLMIIGIISIFGLILLGTSVIKINNLSKKETELFSKNYMKKKQI